MDVTSMRFKEIEHKYVVGDRFDLAAFRAALDGLAPSRHVTLRVCDRYFITEAGRAGRFVIRHRFDREIHQLTLKAVGRDAEVRDEINLDLRAGDQQAQVDAFLGAQGIVWQGALWKDLEVWDFDDCEVVHYTATAGDRSVRCVEFEATHKPTLDVALDVVRRYEAATGFSGAERTPASLLELLWPEAVRRTLGA